VHGNKFAVYDITCNNLSATELTNKSIKSDWNFSDPIVIYTSQFGIVEKIGVLLILDRDFLPRTKLKQAGQPDGRRTRILEGWRRWAERDRASER